jgi:hypothetical protein
MSKNTTEHINEVMRNEVAGENKIPSLVDAQTKLTAKNDLIYITSDPFNGNPIALLGSVLEIRKINGACPTTLNASDASIEFSATKITGIDIDEDSILKEPAKRASIMVDKKLSVELNVLNYLSGQFDGESSFSIMLFDQTSGLVDRNSDKWKTRLDVWKAENKDILDSPEVCYVVAVIGFVQKYIIRRKFEKFKAGAKGGAFGVNLNGDLFTSKEDFSLDIRYGLQTVVLKRPTGAVAKGLDVLKTQVESKPEEAKLFSMIAANKNLMKN